MRSESQARADTESFLATVRASGGHRARGLPLYLQAARAIQQALREHDLPPDRPFPPERELANALRISRPTLRHALSCLQEAGWVYARQGIGTFAAPRVIDHPLELSSLHQDLKDHGLRPATRVLRLDVAPADALVARDLRVAVGTPLVSMERLRLAGNRPVALMETLLHLSGAVPFTKDDLEADGLYNLLRTRCGIEVAMGGQWVTARLASRRELHLLQLRSPAAVLVTRRVTFDAAGRGLEVSTVVFPGGTTFVGRGTVDASLMDVKHVTAKVPVGT